MHLVQAETRSVAAQCAHNVNNLAFLEKQGGNHLTCGERCI